MLASTFKHHSTANLAAGGRSPRLALRLITTSIICLAASVAWAEPSEWSSRKYAGLGPRTPKTFSFEAQAGRKLQLGVTSVQTSRGEYLDKSVQLRIELFISDGKLIERAENVFSEGDWGGFSETEPASIAFVPKYTGRYYVRVRSLTPSDPAEFAVSPIFVAGLRYL